MLNHHEIQINQVGANRDWCQQRFLNYVTIPLTFLLFLIAFVFGICKCIRIIRECNWGRLFWSTA